VHETGDASTELRDLHHRDDPDPDAGPHRPRVLRQENRRRQTTALRHSGAQKTPRRTSLRIMLADETHTTRTPSEGATNCLLTNREAPHSACLHGFGGCPIALRVAHSKVGYLIVEPQLRSGAMRVRPDAGLFSAKESCSQRVVNGPDAKTPKDPPDAYVYDIYWKWSRNIV
jgi:hypothetical protein